MADKNPSESIHMMKSYRIAIVLSGQNLDDSGFLFWLQSCDVTICADGGARHLHHLNRLPDLLVGDLDSINPEDLAWLKNNKVAIDKFPAVKNETDAELAIAKALLLFRQKYQAEQPDISNHQIEIILLGALGGRPDHVLANQMMAGAFARQGYPVVLTDGLSHLFTLAGPGQLILDPQQINLKQQALSVIPLSAQVTGLSYTGLSYPLSDASMSQGSCRGVSNRPVPEKCVTIFLEEGTLLVVVTPEV